MTAVRNVYRVIRSVLFTIVITVVAIFVLAYVALSIPAVHNVVRGIAEKELSAFLKAPVSIDRVTILPMNEVILQDIEIRTPSGRKCISIDRIGAGIGFWKFITGNGIEITYAEITGLNAEVEQKIKDGPLNIAFLIEAFKPKKKNDHPAQFDLKLHNITIRKSSASFSRLWQPVKDPGVFDLNHISLSNIRADVAVPRLKNDDFKIDLRRLSFKERSGIYVDALSFMAQISPALITVKNFKLDFADTKLRINDMSLPINGYKDILPALKDSEQNLQIKATDISASDFAFLNPKIDYIPGTYSLYLDATGRLDNLNIHDLNVWEDSGKFNLALKGYVKGLPEVKTMQGAIEELRLNLDSELAKDIVETFASLPENASAIIEKAKYLQLNSEGMFSLYPGRAAVESSVTIAQGTIDLQGSMDWNNGNFSADVDAETPGFDLATLIDGQPVGLLAGKVSGNALIRGEKIEGISGQANLDIASIEINGNELSNITIDADKSGTQLSLDILSDCADLNCRLSATGIMDGNDSRLNVDGTLSAINLAAFGVRGKYTGVYSAESIYAQLQGDNMDNLVGEARISGVKCKSYGGRDWELNNIGIAMTGDKEQRRINIDSDIVDGEVRGSFGFDKLPRLFTGILAYSLPAYIKAPAVPLSDWNELSYSLTVKNDDKLYDALNIPVRPAAPVRIYGEADNNNMEATVVAPYITKGNKLIKNINFNAKANSQTGFTARIGLDFPIKNQYVNIGVNAGAYQDKVNAALDWIAENKINKGTVRIGMDIATDVSDSPVYSFRIKDSDVMINGETWEVKPMEAVLSNKILTVDNLNISHGDQFLKVSGRASSSPADTLTARLNDIDLSYIFNTLNINYVTFGGRATGNAIATQLFSRNPIATTQGLHVEDFSYNNALLGNAELVGYYDSKNQAVGIGAEIYGDTPEIHTKVDGKIFVTGDSLRLNFDARKINLALIQPFLGNILEKVEGQGSANLSLFGTFQNISLVGKAFADEASVKLGFTGVTYHGSDSVYFDMDGIRIPGFKVYDQYGNSALFGGEVRMKFFHDASVDFYVRDMRNMLCYDLGQGSNPIWWGHVFASGSGRVSGRPGFTRISFDARTEPNSSFTFALDETQVATDYDFLTFVDSRKKKETAVLSVEEQLENQYRKTTNSIDDEGGDFELDLAVTINPNVRMNVIMDPSAGDKITATGTGAMRLNYNSFTDKIDMYGKYTLNDGNYRFTFQDIIIRDFKIRSGSTISFNGDPMDGILNLTAGYRVNTNLSDLDKSFATDRDLNRSSVPVEALIKVTGNLEHPDIGYDISLPTVTGDVERKVRSIVSSDEMMQQQVLYLLALNRFYTPQFSGTSDGELVSVASSTISSQLSNILSQMTDKISLNPSFKSDRNDFSDMEVDLALSSQLFDNRLIINGNLGYRDRSVSQTTFIGDFDLEYLLSKDGRLRLKAYNHFNDAYYYLKSALTTQGVGIIYRKDFDDPFKFLRRKKKNNTPTDKEKKTSGVIKKED